MRIQAAILAVALFCAGAPATAQNASARQIAGMLVKELSPTRSMESGEWFTNGGQTGRDTQALGIIYVYVPGSAGTVSVHAGVFSFLDSGWTKTADVTGLFGMSPQAAAFKAGSVELTTMTPGPNDARCCPSRATRWRVDLATGAATALN